MVVPQFTVPVQEVDDEEVVPTLESTPRQPETQVEYTRRFKRKAETDREQLEREIREDSEELLPTNMEFDWFWVGSGEPVLVASLGTLEGPASFAPATSPEMFSGSLDSVCFNRSNEHDFVKMRLGGQDVLVWTCYPQKHRVSCLKVFSAAFTHTRELLHFFTWVGTCSLVLCWFPLFPCCWVFAGREAWVVDSSPLSLFVTPSASALSANMTPVDLRRLACAHNSHFDCLEAHT